MHSSLSPWTPSVHRGSICKEVWSRQPEPKLPFSIELLLLCLKLACSEKLSCHEFLVNAQILSFAHGKIGDTTLTSNNKPSRFWNANIPLNICPSENKPPLKKTFEKYKPQGLFSEFYGISPNNVGRMYFLNLGMRGLKIAKNSRWDSANPTGIGGILGRMAGPCLSHPGSMWDGWGVPPHPTWVTPHPTPPGFLCSLISNL